jgi:hypothetical protein
LDSKCGQGRLVLTNGEYIEGTFEEDMINGECRFHFEGGTVDGVWEMNRLVHVYQC